MKYALFLGCTVPVRAQNYELSARRVAEAYGIELVDVDEFSCCGFPVKSTHAPTTSLIAARNLALASSLRLDICTLCSSCCSTLTEVNDKLTEDNGLRRELREIGKEYRAPIRVKHFARVLWEDVGLAKIEPSVTKKLSPLKVAAHYGCHYLKPREIFGFDEPEDPESLDELIRATGAATVDYENKKICCGGAILGIDEDDALRIAKTKLDSVKEAQADALISICPFCSIMYEDNQRKVAAKFETEYNLPVLYYPQLLGLALGIDPKDLGIRMNKVKLEDLLSKLE
jgi:heterodisulfide reductase subunit B